MAYGIDDVVQKKVDAYRGNPAALQQRYAQNQELVDLLALQKMKSEKESAAREVQMQMQNTPNTIAQQREQEVLGLTKNEMVKQTGDIMKQRQAQQQSNMARMAQAGIKGQGQAPRMMAGGGIVALAKGGDTKSARIEAIKNNSNLSMAEKKRQIQAIIESGTQLPVGTVGSGRQQGQFGSVPAGMESSALDVIADEGTLTEVGKAKGAGFTPPQQLGLGTFISADGKIRPQQSQQSQQLGLGTFISADGKIRPQQSQQSPVQPPAEPSKPYVTPQLDKGLGQVAAPTARTQYLDGDYGVKMSDASSTADTEAGIKKLVDTDAAAMQSDAMKYGLDTLGMSDERVAQEKARQKALADLDKRQLAGNQREELSAFLRGTAQAGSLAGGSAAAANVRGQQQLGERNRLLGRQKGERDFEGLQQDIKVKAYDSATKAFEIANQNIRQGVSSMTQFNSTEIGLLSDNAKRLLDTDVANMEAEDRDAKRILDASVANASNETKVAVANLEASVSDRRTTLQNQMKRAEEGRLERKDVDQLLNQVAKYAGDVRAKYQKIYQDAIADLSTFGESDKAAEDALKDEMNAAITIALGDLAERTKQLEARRASLPTADGFGDLQ